MREKNCELELGQSDRIQDADDNLQLDIHNNRRECSANWKRIKKTKTLEAPRREFMRVVGVRCMYVDHDDIESFPRDLHTLSTHMLNIKAVIGNLKHANKKDENPPTHREDGDAGEKNTCEIWWDAHDEEKKNLFFPSSKVIWKSNE